MANNTTFTLSLDAEIGNLTAKAEQVKKALTSIGALGKFPELDKGLKDIFAKLDKIRTVAAQPVTGSTFTTLGKDTAAVSSSLGKLMDIMTELANSTNGANLDLLPPEVLNRLKTANGALEAYAAAVEASSQKTKELVDAERDLEASEARLLSWKNKLTDAENARNSAVLARDTTKQELANSKARIAAMQEEVEKRRNDIISFFTLLFPGSNPQF